MANNIFQMTHAQAEVTSGAIKSYECIFSNTQCNFSFPGYLHHTCQLIKENLDKMPGDSRTMIGFITFNSTVHFYNLKVRKHL